MNIERSIQEFSKAKKLIPGGVNSPVRAFRAVGGQPLFIQKARGPYMWDVDGNQFIDYVLSWGPLVLGHAHPSVIESLHSALERGTSYGAPNPLETELAELVIDMIPSLEMIRFVNSGTEATMSALRLARAYTKREKIIKFDGCYHGHADMLLVQAGSGVATLGLPDSPGVPASTVANTLVARYNDLDSVRALFAANPEQIAGIIVEPVAGNMGVVPPVEGFLKGLRQICDENGSVLILDEVMTGFRAGLNGAQTLYGVRPDLTTLGKVIGGGLPVGAYGGKAEIMRLVAPSGPMYQAGTLSGNPLAMSAGIATLKFMRRDGFWRELMAVTDKLVDGVGELARSAGIPVAQTRVGSMFSVFFMEGTPRDWDTVKTADTARFGRYFSTLLENGVYTAPSQFEAGFTSIAHTGVVIDQTLSAVEKAFKAL